MTAMCSDLALAEPLAGTAPVAAGWLIVEQPGPWGRQALTDSHLDPDLGRWLAGLTRAHGIRVLLARHPDRPERAGHRSRNVWLASADSPELRHLLLDDLADLRTHDVGDLDAWPTIGSTEAEPLLLVCTHGRRDACCAVHGRALLTDLHGYAAPAERHRIWECSHVGGHRFAPTTLTLPDGMVHGRVRPADAAAFLRLAMRGQVLPESVRGCTWLSPRLQVAAAHVHAMADADGTDLTVAGLHAEEAAEGAVEIVTSAGRAWRIDLVEEPLPAARPESCGAEAKLDSTWRVTRCRRLA